MNEFALASDADFRILEERCREQCLVFQSRNLPPGCARDRARVGFESDGAGVSLLMEKGIAYTGPNGRLAKLFAAGTLRFPNFPALKDFLRQEVAASFASSVPPDLEEVPLPTQYPAPRVPATYQSPHDLPETDLPAVHDALHQAKSRPVVHAPDLKEKLRARVVGQDQALTALAGLAARHVNRLQPNRAASAFLIGPTGVGKTRSAQVLAECLTESGMPYDFLRLDMCEYQEAHRVSQLLGSPQGYVGYGDGAQLTRKLARQPRTVVLLDEIEKAHPDIFKSLMNALDSGRLSSATPIAGQHDIDCRLAIFLLTSNLAAADLVAASGEAQTPQAEDALCRRHLKQNNILPELVGRIGAFGLFRPLSETDRAHILLRTVAKVAGEYGVRVDYVAPEVLVGLLHETNGDFGARPDEQSVDRIFGETFAAARVKGAQSVRLGSLPPSGCSIPGKFQGG